MANKKPPKITHILKDGRVLDDITGYKVRREQCPVVYEILERLNTTYDAKDVGKMRIHDRMDSI